MPATLAKDKTSAAPAARVSAGPESTEPETRPLRPLPLRQAFVYFGLPGLAFFAAVWAGIPLLTDAGMSEFAAYLWALMVPSALMLVAALVGLRSEGWPLTRSSLQQRYRYHRMTRREWTWTGGAVLVALFGFALLSAVAAQLVDSGVIPVPGDMPAILDPRASSDELLKGYGGAIVGRWELVVLYFVALLFNIVGEELWWRGYILPRQELAHGSRAWLAQGLLWGAFHFFKWWEILPLLAVTLTIPFVSQRLQSNTPAVIVHCVVNGVSFIVFILLVAGVVSL